MFPYIGNEPYYWLHVNHEFWYLSIVMYFLLPINIPLSLNSTINILFFSIFLIPSLIND